MRRFSGATSERPTSPPTKSTTWHKSFVKAKSFSSTDCCAHSWSPGRSSMSTFRVWIPLDKQSSSATWFSASLVPSRSRPLPSSTTRSPLLLRRRQMPVSTRKHTRPYSQPMLRLSRLEARSSCSSRPRRSGPASVNSRHSFRKPRSRKREREKSRMRMAVSIPSMRSSQKECRWSLPPFRLQRKRRSSVRSWSVSVSSRPSLQSRRDVVS
ncbi:hypothetical protein D6D25_06817, partial [Aureobasidium pullulans]